jgi:hypothetical protein
MKMKRYIVRPIEPSYVMERRTYIKENEKSFTVQLFYKSVGIVVSCNEEPVIDIEECPFGTDINKYLTAENKYSNVNFIFTNCYGIHCPDAPEYVKKAMIDITEEMDFGCAYYPDWDYRDCCCALYACDYSTEVWVYTSDFTVECIERPPPVEEPSRPYVYLEPLEEVQLEMP